MVDELLRLPANEFILDGEIAAFDSDGKSSFQLLQARINRRERGAVLKARQEVPSYFMVFDLVACEGYDLRGVTLEERRRVLRTVLPGGDWIRRVEVLESNGRAFFELAQKSELEGIVAKEASSLYTSKRSPLWQKVKTAIRGNFVIGGFMAPAGSRNYFGSLVVGRFQNGALEYNGRVGTGFDEELLKTIHAELESRIIPECPFETVPKESRDAIWVRPELVCEVRFNEWTRDRILRAPSFQGLRPGIRALDCRVEVTEPSIEEEPEGPAQADEPAPVEDPLQQYSFLSNLDKVFWPEKGYTKRDLVAFYHEIAPFLLPYLQDRPMNLERYPDGWQGKSFYQKDAPDFIPDWIATAEIDSDSAGKTNRYIVCNDRQTLVYLANLACVPLHPWSSRVETVDFPDFLIIDLDPDPKVAFVEVCRFANKVRETLETLELKSYPKTSGSKGIHILVPLQAEYTYQMVRGFGEIVARLAVHGMEDLATFDRSMVRRAGKIYVDFLQNGRGKTIVSPYCIRPRAGAPVSTPLEWSEVGPGIRPESFHIKNIFRRLERKGDLFQPVLREKQSLRDALERLEGVLGGQDEPAG